MHDSVVRRRKALGDLRGEIDRLSERQPAVRERSQVRPVDELGGQEADPPVCSDVEDRDDVRIRDGGGRAGFAFESRQPLGVGRKLGPQGFQGHIAPEPGVPRPVDLSHSARTESGENLVGSEAGSGGKRHESVGAILPRQPRRTAM